MGISRWIIVIFMAAGLMVAGCGDDEETGDGGAAQTATEEQTEPSEAVSQTIEISATDFKFDPANPKVEKAGVVEFRLTNDGQSPHALEVEGPEGEVESDVIQPGKATTLKADLGRRGSFVIYCPVGNHRDLGMEGKVQVAGGGASAREDGGGSGGEDEKDGGRGSYNY